MVTRNFLDLAASEAKIFQAEVDKVLLIQREINMQWNSIKNEAERKVLHEPIHHTPSSTLSIQYRNSNISQKKKRNIKGNKSSRALSQRMFTKPQNGICLTTRENMNINSQENFWITTQLSEKNPIYFQVPNKSSHHFELSSLPIGKTCHPRPRPTPHSARYYAKKSDI